METNTKTILYVDDDPDDLAMFRMAVETLGSTYRIVEAFDGMQALAILMQMEQSNALPSLIVLDINMPRMDGKQTLVAIQNKPELACIPIVLFSTSSSQIDRVFSESKKVELITKPFSFETLRAVTHKLLRYLNE
jgi:CheY-like chemotaxis protein